MPLDAQDNNKSNFWFLEEHQSILLQLTTSAENAFYSDPNTTLIKLRQFGEALAQDLAMRAGIEFDNTTSQADLLGRLSREIGLDAEIRNLLHTLRIEGNKATHEFQTQHREAMLGLKAARALAVWFHRSFGKQGSAFKPGPFAPPTDPSQKLRDLQTQIDQLNAELQSHSEQEGLAQQRDSLLAQEREEYQQLAELMDQEARKFEQQAKDAERALAQQKQQFEAQIAALKAQITAGNSPPDLQRSAVATQTQQASATLVLDEELTRVFIDQMLQDAGWEADTQALTYKSGTRPEKGKNKAIAEWPTATGPADYVLFAGLVPIAVVEAKRENKNVAGMIPQAERYAKGFKPAAEYTPAWQYQGLTIAWPDDADGHYQIPFVYACNGRDYIKQLEEQSGTWFRDVRASSNVSGALQGFHSPDGLLDKLTRDRQQAEQKLSTEGFDYLGLRDYQEKAIKAVEAAIANNQRECLLAMATGTGKTRTIIGLMYRFLKAERFKRILFLVDRSALGTQAQDAFNEAQLEQNQPLSKIYNVNELGDMAPEAETRVQVATVQSMVKRIFHADTPPPVDQFDCIIVDEAHRGYTLDQDMTDGELAVRDASQYLSSYRRVLDYFDAVKVGLTATPAKHTSDIFGKPVYTYSYREAVADDWLIDHEPPIRYETLLTQNGITFVKGELVQAINTATGEVESSELEDDLGFEVEAFNKRVINENFNRVICQQLAQELDPFGDEKSMIFCATDLHADMVKRLLDEAFVDVYNGEYKQSAVAKITGQSDKVSQLIARYKNERYPNIAITVDLLTTGIDVPKIAHLVFLRRVRSRILYEQMIGRATRRCDEIGKTVFRIYDPVDIYAALEAVSTMKPLVKNPNISLEQLCEELTDPTKLEAGLNAPGDTPEQSQADVALSQLGQRVMQVLRKASSKADSNPKVKAKLEELQYSWGVEPAKLHQHLHTLGPRQAANFLNQHSGFLNQLAQVKQLLGSERMPVISEHEDEFMVREQNYGKHKRPEDYLDSFNDFIRRELNQSAALSAVVTRPRDLTREQLKEIRLLLDNNGYTEASLRSAWRQQTNQDIAASILGHIRRAALGEAMIPFEQRVHTALQNILSSHNWSPVQRKWLERLGKQLTHEVVIDQDTINQLPAFTGGARQLDKILGDQLDNVLEAINDSLWEAS
ncbi:type I restriction-modification system endonuclease [Spongiibacter taiwanensis]|uniref:type I restriction-modification system endonuclease n=1 Tax=Spongiibacter taiwanensis TaxID=1748242 RepID=UPI0020362134|nr:type I restriction-modification system endonuclease [Spongiibacter taiwanensis]USA44530.1 type I restriction-modification system endonuclease [Spongiibacter taiwanensis]